MGTRLGLTDRQARSLAWGLFAIAVALFAGVVVFGALGWGRCGATWRSASAAGDRACRILLANDDIGTGSEGIGFASLGVLFAALGAVVAARRRGNALGWIFIATGVLFAANAFTTLYTVHASEAPGALPAAALVAVAVEVLGGPVVFAPFVLFFLLFPNGMVLSPRWRWAVAAVGVSIVLQSVALAFHPFQMRLAPLLTNPIALPISAGARAGMETVAFVLLLVSLVASVISLVLRFRRSHGVERQQMKWFTTSSAFVGVTFLFAPLFWSLPQLEVLWGPMFLLATASVPVAATVAILRYRLYDLDVLINRALVYGALTALLGAAYLGTVVLMQTLLSNVGGGTDIAVAASTLAVAALFRPVRRRVQLFIDRRFYRRKYSALQAVDTFSARLRQETDLSTLRGDLLMTVQNTIQPAGAMLWLRDDRPA